jgi:hypothetical protein
MPGMNGIENSGFLNPVFGNSALVRSMGFYVSIAQFSYAYEVKGCNWADLTTKTPQRENRVPK